MKNKRYISYSEIYTFYEKGQITYFQEYVLGVREPATMPLKLGAIVHEMIADKKYDWKSELIKQGFTSDYERIVDKINSSVPRFDKHELKIFAETDMGFELYAGIDAVEELKGEAIRGIEYKTGKSLWTKERADESEQITHYVYTLYKFSKNLLPFRLISMSTSNGKIKEFDTFRTKEQLDNWEKKLIQFRDELIKLDWWTKKAHFADRITL